jgi:hypothetical protein
MKDTKIYKIDKDKIDDSQSVAGDFEDKKGERRRIFL